MDGRIDDSHVDRLLSVGVADVVVGRHLFGAPDPGRQAAALSRRITEASGKAASPTQHSNGEARVSPPTPR